MNLSRDDNVSSDLAKEQNQLLTTIRNIPGFETSLRPRICEDILLPDEGPIVTINVHNDRCDALALIPGVGRPRHIPLPKFSYQKAEHLVHGFRGHLDRCEFRTRSGEPSGVSRGPDITLEEILSALWSDVVWPILDFLAFSVPDTESESYAKLPRVWWCPTGPLAFLPIHAAGNYTRGETMPKQCLSDFAVSSYIPSVNALLKANSVKKRGNSPVGWLIVSQPSMPNHGAIPGVKEEADRVEKQLEKRGIPYLLLADESATVERLLEAMESFPSIHIACDASKDSSNPFKKSLHLHHGPLELSEIMQMNLPYSEFVFLSASNTSTPDENHPDEAIHFAAGMLSAGYRSVVGTMLPVSDDRRADLAELFYESLLDDTRSKIDGGGAARALHRALQRFRKQTSDLPYSPRLWIPYIHLGV